MQNSTSLVETPSLKRRLICLVYDAFLVTAVAFLGMLIVLLAAKAMKLSLTNLGDQIVLIVVSGAYFIHSWTGSGHTLAMKTWRIKLVKVGYARVPFKAALIRYVFGWGWVLPALVTCYRFKLHGYAEVSIAVAVGVVVWGLMAFLDKDEQFLHDRMAGTRLISLPKPVKKKAANTEADIAGSKQG